MCQHPFYLAFRTSSIGTVLSVLFILIISLKKDMLSSFAFVYILILIRWHFPANLSAGTCAGRADIYQQFIQIFFRHFVIFPSKSCQVFPLFRRRIR